MWHFDGPRNKKIMYLKYIFHFHILNMDIAFTIPLIHLTFSVCSLKILLEGSVSPIFNYLLVFFFMAKKG